MNRVETAIKQGRCVLAIGTRALAQPNVQAELRRRHIPVVALGGEAVNPALPVTVDNLFPATSQQGGVLVLVEPEPGSDGRGLAEIERAFKSAAHKPRLVIAARAFNPFGLPMALRLAKMDQAKKRAVDFLSSLPVDAGAVVVQAPSADHVAPGAGPSVRPKARPAKKKERRRAPRPVFVGREDELATLTSMLNEDGGPIIVHGAPGVGRRWLVERALATTNLDRIPDLTFARGTGFDTFAGRIAMAAKVAGDDRLHAALTAKEALTPAAFASLAVDVLAGDAMAGKVLVLHRLHDLQDRRDGSFYRNGRLETLLRAVFQGVPKLRLVAISDLPLCFYREGEGVALRQLSLGGLKGKELHELFAALNVPEFARDRFGPIHDRTHGHPLATRCFAMSVARDGDVDKVLERQRFLKAENVQDVRPTLRHLKRRMEKIEPELRAALAAIALPREPVTTEVLTELGINRNTRIDLLAHGWLEQTPAEDGRCFYVHPLVTAHLTLREIEDFDRMEAYAHHIHGRARSLKSDGKMLESFAAAQEGNRMLVAARRGRSVLRLPYADTDAQIDEVRGMMRRRTPRLDIARMRLNELKKKVSGNTELMLCDTELLINEQAKPEAIQAAFDLAIQTCATPEVFHSLATWHQTRNARGKATQVLEEGIKVFAKDARLHRRLAGFLLGMNRPLDAVDVLKRASDLEPMMPDTYGMLGEIYAELGTNRWDDAEACISEARRLAPNNPNHMARAAGLLHQRAMVDAEQTEAILEQAETLLREAMTFDKENRRVLVLLATVILDRGGDLEQAQWLLKQAARRQGNNRRRRREDPAVTVQRARLLIRQAAFEEAERLLVRVLKSNTAEHTAHAVQGEFFLAQGQLLPAHAAYKTARERCPVFAPQAARYDAVLAGLQAHLAAGHAIIQTAPAQPSADAVPQAQAGTREGTIIRRRKDDEEGDAVQAQAAVPAQAAAPESEEAAVPAAEAAAPESEEAAVPAAEAAASESEEASTEAIKVATQEGADPVEPAPDAAE